MSEWTKTTLGEVLTLQRGFDLPSRLRTPGPYPIVSSSGVTGFHDEFKVAPPGVVIGRYGSLGTVHWIDQPYWPLNTSLWVKDFKGNDERFVSYLLRTINADGSAASAVPGVNRNHLHQQTVVVPPMAVQRRIAGVLSAFDALIEINERRIALLTNLVRSLYREWFEKLRFPGWKHAAFIHTDLGPIPRGWRVGALQDVAVVNARSVARRSLPDPVRYFDISAVDSFGVGQGIEMPAAEAPGRARRALSDGDTVWATVRPNRRAHGVVFDPSPNAIASTGLAVITPSRANAAFVFAATDTTAFSEWLVGRATGSAYPAVRPTDFEEAPLLIPDQAVLTQFGQVAEPALRMAHSARLRSMTLRNTRDLLLPRLVTGQIDLCDIDLGNLLPTSAA